MCSKKEVFNYSIFVIVRISCGPLKRFKRGTYYFLANFNIIYKNLLLLIFFPFFLLLLKFISLPKIVRTHLWIFLKVLNRQTLLVHQVLRSLNVFYEFNLACKFLGDLKG